MVLDVFVPKRKTRIDFSSIYRKLLKLLPTLERHKCGEDIFNDLKNHKELPSEKVEGMTHIAHLIEHVIIDLQSNITRMDSCSGITCGYKKPEHRFDLFIECRDEKVGRFSSLFAVDLMKRMLMGKNPTKRDFRMIELVRYLRENLPLAQKSRSIGLESRIASDLGWRRRSILSLIKDLRDFGFLDSRQVLPNSRIL